MKRSAVRFSPKAFLFVATTIYDTNRRKVYITTHGLHHLTWFTSPHMVYITPHGLHHLTRFTSPHMVYITSQGLHHLTRFTSPHTVYFTTLTDSDLISTIIDHNNNLSHKKWFTSPHTWITTPNYQCKFTCSPPPPQSHL